MAISDSYKNKTLDAIFRGGTLTGPSHLYIALFTNSGEVDASEYERQEITFTRDGDTQTKNDSKISFPIALSKWGTITQAKVFDAKSGGTLVDEGTLETEPETVDKNKRYTIPAGYYVSYLEDA